MGGLLPIRNPAPLAPNDVHDRVPHGSGEACLAIVQIGCPMVRIGTVAREYGSGGAGIANALALRLGWRLVDNPLIGEIASISIPRTRLSNASTNASTHGAPLPSDSFHVFSFNI